MNGYAQIAEVIKEIAKGVTQSLSPTNVAILELVSVTPLKFRKSIELELDSEIVIPRGLFFSENDIGKHYVFIKNEDGQEYYFLYERGNAK